MDYNNLLQYVAQLEEKNKLLEKQVKEYKKKKNNSQFQYYENNDILLRDRQETLKILKWYRKHKSFLGFCFNKIKNDSISHIKYFLPKFNFLLKYIQNKLLGNYTSVADSESWIIIMNNLNSREIEL